MDDKEFALAIADIVNERKLEASNPQDPRIHGIGFKKAIKAA